MNCNAGCCRDLRIAPIDLIFPERMSVDGLAFVHAHGINITRLADLRDLLQTSIPVNDGSGWVTVYHRCQNLTQDNRCAIYDMRPTICRDFDCSQRADHLPEVPMVMPLLFRKGTVN